MLTVALVSFSLFNYVGDPINNMVGIETTEAERQQIRAELGLDDPVYVQFLRFVRNIASGEFGVSYRLTRPVNEIIIERLPATIELSLVSAFIAMVLVWLAEDIGTVKMEGSTVVLKLISGGGLDLSDISKTTTQNLINYDVK